jgi:hypothetical protein
MSIGKWDDLQLRFDLPGFDDSADDASERAITPEEARQISEAARSALEAKAGKGLGASLAPLRAPDWFQDYLMLIEHGWPWRVATYIAWASSPKNGRKPETLQDLARDVLGLKGPRVIYTWRIKYASIDTVVAMMQAAPLFEHRRDVLQALTAMAKKEDYKAHNDRKLYLEMTGDYVPRSVVGVGKMAKGGAIENLSDEELRHWMGEETTEPLSPTPEDQEGADAG